MLPIFRNANNWNAKNDKKPQGSIQLPVWTSFWNHRPKMSQSTIPPYFPTYFPTSGIVTCLPLPMCFFLGSENLPMQPCDQLTSSENRHARLFRTLKTISVINKLLFVFIVSARVILSSIVCKAWRHTHCIQPESKCETSTGTFRQYLWNLWSRTFS